MGVNLSQVACKGRQSVDRLIYLHELSLTLSAGSLSSIILVSFVIIYPGLFRIGKLRVLVDGISSEPQKCTESANLKEFTRIPSLAHSTAKLEAKCLTAALDALYGV